MEAVVSKALNQALEATKTEGALKPHSEGDGGFRQMLQEQLQQSDATTKLVEGMLGPSQGGGNSFKVMPGSEITVDVDQFAGSKRTDILTVLNDVNRSALQMDTLIEMVTSGQSFSPQELLAVQAGVYQIVQEVDLTGQIVSSADRARNSLLNIQI